MVQLFLLFFEILAIIFANSSNISLLFKFKYLERKNKEVHIFFANFCS